ncbi:DUF2975 domain-containing protein [Tabrizicola sp.]|uniref:DUF2975 domain-containing protein n=1 Tax=Tabrizicola sp. TaxID=2005166 RepID=UPI003F2E72E3
MPDQTRLARLSETLYWTALVLSAVLPLIVLFYAGKGLADPASLLARASGLPAETPVTRLQAGLVAAIALISVLPMVAALRAMTRLFGRYRAGEVLSDTNAETILQIGRALILVAVFTVVTPTLVTLILSWNAPQRTLSIGVDSGTLGFLMAAGLLTVIGWAMREAARVKAENEGFV